MLMDFYVAGHRSAGTSGAGVTTLGLAQVLE